MITIHHPKIFKGVYGLEALFTEANRNVVNQEGVVPGLNLGYNTDATTDEVNHNFDNLFSFLGWYDQKYTIANQVHGTRVEIVSNPGIVDDTDGLITTLPNLALGIRVADCAAVLIADPEELIIGAFHAGWKGAAGGIIPAGIDKMNELGGDPSKFLVFISPCISLKNFEVGEEVAALFPDEFIYREGFKKPHVNLKGFIVNQLVQKGVVESNIQLSEMCTVDDRRFFSYRREREMAGRMLAMIKLT
jgi:polyphenol oxidase